MTLTNDPPDSTDPTATTNDAAEATVNRDADGDPLGASLFLSAEQLAALGIELDSTRQVEYWIDDSGLRVGPTITEGDHE